MYQCRVTFLPVLLLAIASLTLANRMAQAQSYTPSLAVSAPQVTQLWDLPQAGPPTTDVRLQGSGFDPLTAVDIYFDSTLVTSTTTDSSGSFGNGVVTVAGPALTHLQVPASALPGEHTITAQEHVGQKSAQKSFLVRTDWAQFRFEPHHSGTNPYENILSADTAGSLALQWSYPTPGGVYFSSPAVVNGMVYIGSADNTLFALNADTGALVWQFAVGYYVDSSPTIVNGVVYFGVYFYDHNLYALNANTGTVIWTYQTDSRTSSVAVANGIAYVGSENGVVYALKADTGELVWSYPIQYSQINSSPAVANGIVYFGDYLGNFYALNADTGALIWKRELSVGGVFSSPAVVDGVIYVGGGDGNYYALDASTGTQIWVYAVGGDGVVSSPAVTNGVVYFGAPYGDVLALDAKTGANLWHYTTGDMVWSSPAVANGVVYIGSQDSKVYAFDAVTGSLLWSYATQQPILSSPAVANGMVYIGSEDGNMYAFGLPSMKGERKSTSAMGLSAKPR